MWYKKISSHITQPPTVFHLLLIIQLAIFLFFIFRPFTLTPPGHAYTTIDINNNFFYVNVILQSKEGAWNIIDANTTLFTPRIYAYLFFVVLGKVALLFNVSPVMLYLFARVMCGVLAFYATYWLITTLLPKQYRVLAILFALGVEAGPLLSEYPTVVKTIIDARILIFRHFGLPHHLFAQATGMLFIGLLFLSIQKMTPKRLVMMLLFGVISNISMPAYLFTFALCVFPVWALWSVITKTIRRVVVPFAVATFAIVAPNLIFAIEFTKGPPWTNSTPNEKLWYTLESLRTEYISTLLFYVPIIIIFILLFPFLWRTLDAMRKQVVVVMTSWLIGPLIWVEVAHYSWFPMPHHRLTDGYGFVPAGILVAMTVHYIFSRLPTKHIKILAATVLLALVFIPSLFFTNIFTRYLFAKQDANVTDHHMYPSAELWEGIRFLSTLPGQPGVLMREQLGEIILGFANVRVYVGGIHNFPDWTMWSWLSYKFLAGGESLEEASTFLKYSNIDYVFRGPDEKAVNPKAILYPSLLEPVFTNKEVTIYKVKK